MKAQIYYCKTHTERADKSNLYYIQVNAAHAIRTEGKKTEILNRHGTIIATFITL